MKIGNRVFYRNKHFKSGPYMLSIGPTPYMLPSELISMDKWVFDTFGGYAFNLNGKSLSCYSVFLKINDNV